VVFIHLCVTQFCTVKCVAAAAVVFTGAWLERAKEAAATNALIDESVDVVGMHVDPPATAVQTAESRGVHSIGFRTLLRNSRPRVGSLGWALRGAA